MKIHKTFLLLHCVSSDDWGFVGKHIDVLICVSHLIDSTQAAHNTSLEAWLHCVLAPSALLPQEILVGGGHGLMWATEHTRGRPAVILMPR